MTSKLKLNEQAIQVHLTELNLQCDHFSKWVICKKCGEFFKTRKDSEFIYCDCVNKPSEYMAKHYKALQKEQKTKNKA
jgi:uncharacterized C2H2 Zn-finger protein